MLVWRLREHPCRRFALRGRGFGLDGVGSTVASTKRMTISTQPSHAEGEVVSYKKNFGSPLTTALINASLAVGFFGIGLQKAKGSQQASLEVRYR